MEKFIENFASQFDETEISEFAPGVNFRDLDEWDSMIALSVIAMINDEYNVNISGEEIRKSNSISDLYACVNAL